MSNFSDIEKIEITDAQLGKLKELFESGNFLVFREVVESYILKKTGALLTGTPAEGIDEENYFRELKGFAKNWKHLLEITKRHEQRYEK